MDQNQKLIEASKTLKEYCLAHENYCSDCIFYTDRCCLSTLDMPEDWKIPKLRRWSDDDIALAKALKAVGANEIKCDSNKCSWTTPSGETGLLPFPAFRALHLCEAISIDEIIAEENK